MSRRIRAHINPFKCRRTLLEEDWSDRYTGGPIGIDIGCAKGEFAAQLAALHPDGFFIGVELRPAVAEKYFGNYANVPNLVLLTGNINLSLKTMFTEHKVNAAYINFPDPYSHKLRLKKRRMVTRQFVVDLHDVMNRGAKVYFQTDDAGLFSDSHLLFAEKFTCVTNAAHPGQVENQAGAQSAWERECLRKGAAVYRAVYKK